MSGYYPGPKHRDRDTWRDLKRSMNTNCRFIPATSGFGRPNM